MTPTIYPSFLLHNTVTGRSSSRDPSAQNFPKRGKLAKEFRKVFIPRDGFTLIQGDLSQAELRVAAWMAREQNMIRIYLAGGDIHEYTAAAILGIPVKAFQQMKDSEKSVPSSLKVSGFDGETYGEYYDFKRFQAKSVAFKSLTGSEVLTSL